MKRNNLCATLLIVITVAVILLFSRAPNLTAASPTNKGLTKPKCSKVTGLSYPPFKKNKHVDFTLRELSNLNLRKIKIAINWRNREPKKGVFKWRVFDNIIRKAKENNITIFLTFPSSGPDWACSEKQNMKSCVFKNDQDFKDYLQEFFTRYPNVLERVQFGNEWETHYAGSMADFVKFNNILYQTVQTISPETKVVLGGFSRAYPMAQLLCNSSSDTELQFNDLQLNKNYSQKTLNKKLRKTLCNQDILQRVNYVLSNARYDELDIHLYDDPINWPQYVNLLPKGKDIVVSEFGGPSSVFEKVTEDYQEKRIREYLRTIEALPITEAYYFKLLDSPYSYHKHSGLFTDKFTKKKSYSVFSECTNPQPPP